MPYFPSLLVLAALSGVHPGPAPHRPLAWAALTEDSSFSRSQSAAHALSVDRDASALSYHAITIGADFNSMANQVAPGVTLGLPVSRLVTIVARPMLLGGETSADLDVGGRLEVQLQSPIYMDHVRAYFGAGPQAFYEVRGTERHHHDVSGGWDAGIEVFLSHSFALHWEMGTSGGGVAGGAGPVFTVGFRAYPRRKASH